MSLFSSSYIQGQECSYILDVICINIYTRTYIYLHIEYRIQEELYRKNKNFQNSLSFLNIHIYLYISTMVDDDDDDDDDDDYYYYSMKNEIEKRIEIKERKGKKE